MAFVQQDDEQNKQQAQGQPQTPTTASAPGAGPASSSGKSTPQSTPAQPFQNLQAYLSANQPQVAQQANKIAGDLTNQYGQVQSDINNAKTDFQGQVQAGYAQPNDEMVKNAAADPSAFVSNPQNVQAFQSLYNDAYTGPQNFESTSAYQNLSKEAMDAANKAAQVNTTGGLKTFFQNQNPNATAGGNTLDSVLLQGSPDAITQVQNAAKPFSTLNDYLNQTVTEGNNAVTNAQNQAKSISQGLQNQFTGEGGLIPTLNSDLSSRLTNLQGTQQQAADKAIGDFLAGSLTEADAAALGVSLPQLQSIYSGSKDLNSDYGIQNSYLPGFISQVPADTAYNNLSFAATPEEASKAKALAMLTGTQPLVSESKTPGSLVNFNTQGAQDATTSKLRNMDIQTLNNTLLSAPLYAGSASSDPMQNLMFLANNPAAVSKIQSSLSGSQLKVFNDALQRMGIGATPPTGGTDTGGVFTPWGGGSNTEGNVTPGGGVSNGIV